MKLLTNNYISFYFQWWHTTISISDEWL